MNKLREINKDEIDFIVNSIRNISYPKIDIYDAIFENIRNNIVDQLRGKLIVPSKKYLENLRDEILKFMITGRVENESFKGIQASHTINNFTNQTMLHAKRGQGGAKTYVSAFDTIKSNVKFNKEPKVSIVYTFTKTRYNFEDIGRIFIPLFTNVLFSEIIYEFMVINKDDDDKISYDWYDDIEVPKLNYDKIFMRIFLKKDVLYEMKITRNEILNSLNDSSNGLFTAIVSPTIIGLIDIYPNPRELRKSNLFKQERSILNDEFMVMMFLSGTFAPNFTAIQISGIDGVKYVQPMTVKISSCLNRETLINEQEGIWEIDWDQVTATNSGIFFEDVEKLFEPLGVLPVVYDNIPDKMFFLHWPYNFSPLSLVKVSRFSEYFRESQEEKNGWKVYYEIPNDMTINQEKNILQDIFFVLYPRSKLTFDYENGWTLIEVQDKSKEVEPILKIQNFLNVIGENDELSYMEITSNNFISILSHDQIDMRKTHTNNSRLTVDCLGTEAYRSMFIRSTSSLLLASGKEFNSRHIELIVDHLVMHGFITPVSIIGTEGQRLGPFVESSFQEADKILNKAAEFGRTDNINTPSAFITIGKKGNYGRDYARSIGKPIVGSKEEIDIFMNYQNQNDTEYYFELKENDKSPFDKTVDLMTENVRNKEVFRSLFLTTRTTSSRPLIRNFKDIKSQFPSIITMKSPIFSNFIRFCTLSIVRFITERHDRRQGNIINLVFSEQYYIPNISTLFSDFKHINIVFNKDFKEEDIKPLLKKNDILLIWEGVTTLKDEILDDDKNYIIVFKQDINGIDEQGFELARELKNFLGDTTILFSSCLQINPRKDEEIIRKMQIQYNWTVALKPVYSNLTYIVPRFNDKKNIYNLTDLPENSRFSMKSDYEDGSFQYFVGDVVLIPYIPFGNFTSFLHTKAETFDYQYKFYQKTMTYYNLFERPYIYHDNSHSDKNLGFDHCNDCSLENWIWEEYLKFTKSKKSVKSLVQTIHFGQGGRSDFKKQGHGYFFNPPFQLERINKIFETPSYNKIIRESEELNILPDNRTISL